MERRKFITTAGSIAAIGVGLAGCSGSSDEPADAAEGGSSGDSSDGASGGGESSPESTPKPTEAPRTTQPPATTERPDVTIQEHSMEKDAIGDAVVKGTVKNTSGEEQGYIEVQAYFFDSSDTRLGEGMDNATDVPAGQSIAFECISTVEYSKVDRYEIEASTSL